jgi:molybdate/tungstate transport system substrate-binding protein
MIKRHSLLGVVLLLCGAASGAASQTVTGPLVVFNAGSLGAPFRELLLEFRRSHPGIQPRQESSGSLEAARKLTELDRIPDVLAVADSLVIPSILVPEHAGWYASFARNAMVLVYSDRSTGGREINGRNWYEVLLRPGVRTGRSDPALDPNGYRTLLVTQLAEKHYGVPGLAARLLQAMPRRYMRPKEADLVALVQAGELDYAWSYRSIARSTGLRAVALPREVDLSDPALGRWYAQAQVRLAGPGGAADSLVVTGAPIVYALTIPRRADNPATAEAFVRFVFSPAGKAILGRNGFLTLDQPIIGGSEIPGWLRASAVSREP